MSATITIPTDTAAAFLTHFFGSGLVDDARAVQDEVVGSVSD